VKIVVIGAGQVGSAVIEALHDEHEVTVVDLDGSRLNAIAHRHDVTTVEGNGATRSVLQDAGIGGADLLIACSSRDEPNIIAAMLAKKLNPRIRTVVRAVELEYLEAWHERHLDVDLVVSSEIETAYAVSRTLGVPAARQTDVFAEGQVQIVEFDVEVDRGAGDHDVIGRPLRSARIPKDSKVASIIRGDSALVPRGDQSIQVGDRIIIIGSPRAAQDWSLLIAGDRPRLDDVVIYGAGRIGFAVADQLLRQEIRVRIVEANREKAAYAADKLPDARVFNATGLDPEFLERERIGQSRVAVFAMQNDAKNHYAGALVKLYGVAFTIAVVDEPISTKVFERSGIDVSVNPRQLTAEELVRFAHDPRTQQVAMLEEDRYEVLDVTVRAESALVNKRFRELPMTGALIGAIVREGKAIFPHGDDVLLPGDRAIVFTESRRAGEVEKAL
jgi:trk system potassium uptake protein TrkA